MAEPTSGFACCFCGEHGDDDDRITVLALWKDQGEEKEQGWWSHRACLMERLHERVRTGIGPLFPDW
jgi:hypothetical protein